MNVSDEGFSNCTQSNKVDLAPRGPVTIRSTVCSQPNSFRCSTR